MTVAAGATNDMHATLMQQRLQPVRDAGGAAAQPLRKQWRRVANVLFARSSGWGLVRQFAGIGAIVLLRTLLQVRQFSLLRLIARCSL